MQVKSGPYRPKVSAVTIVTDCPKCHLAIPVKTAGTEVSCPHCKTSVTIAWEMNSRLERALVTQVERAIETGKTSTATDTRLTVTVEMLDQLPCDNCKNTLDLSTIEKNRLSCANCHNDHGVGEFNHLQGIDHMVAGMMKKMGEGDHSLGCSSCGASLKMDVSVRMQVCEFCQRETLIPDAMWQRLHPELLIGPFYLLMEDVMEVEKLASQSTDLELLDELASHFYYKVRIAVAANPNINIDIARKLFKDRNGNVIVALKNHPDFHRWFKLEVFLNKEEAKEFAAMFPEETNPDLSEQEMMELAKQHMPKRLAALAYNPAITTPIMTQIIRQKSDLAWIALSKRIDLTPAIIKLLISQNNAEVNRILSKNSALPSQTVTILSVSNDKLVLQGLIENTNVPDDIKHKIQERLKKLN